ncbi:MAG TPA: hypothetical protein VG605_21890 [Puia sp.]|nr:hypothetical protein [Puia sp.]
MEQEKEFTSQESLALITKMITRARRDYLGTGLSALLWGSVITFCSLVAFATAYFKWSPALNAVWLLTIVAAIVQGFIAVREAKARRHKPYDQDLMGGIWIAFAIAVFMLSFIFNLYPSNGEPAIYLGLYGVPTFATGYARRFRPMVIGGIICWILALISLRIGYPYTLLCITAGAVSAWFIPGLIIRKRYLKAKQQHV